MLFRMLVLTIFISVPHVSVAKCNNTLLPGCGSKPQFQKSITKIPSQVPKPPKPKLPTGGKSGGKFPIQIVPKAPQVQASPQIIPAAPGNQAQRPRPQNTTVSQTGTVWYKMVCQTPTKWCYLNSQNPKESGATCHCRGDIGKIR